MSGVEWQVIAVTRQRSQSRTASVPWRLLITSALLGAAVVLGRPEPGSQPTAAGRAQLSSLLKPTQPGWQMQLDPRALDLGPDRLQQTLESVAGPVNLTEFGDSDDRLINLVEIEGSPLSVTPSAPTARGPGSDKLFGGSPAVVFEWSKRAFAVRGNLYKRVGASSVLAGRLVGTLPFVGIQGTGPGFRVDQLGLVPSEVEALVAIDPTVLRFLSRFRDPVQKEWDRWEFTPFSTLGTALGPCLVYMRWHGEALFSLGVKDIPTVEKAIAKRFPESVIRTAATWSNGARIRGFNPNGPAWLIRGDTLLASKSGGTTRLAEALASAMKARETRPSPLMTELARLSASEPGWHAMVIKADPGSAVRWAAVLRWPEPTMSRVEGFVVVELLSPPRP